MTGSAEKTRKRFSRIVTHTDFDGLISALLLRDILDIDNVVFAEPWMLQQGKYDVHRGDVIVDLPYDEHCALWIDHHASNDEVAERVRAEHPEKVVFDSSKKSCPSLLHEHFHAEHMFLDEPATQQLIAAADKIDSASFTREELSDPNAIDACGLISMSLKSDDKRKDDEYRRLLLNFLSYLTPEKVIEQKLIQARIERKREEQERWRRNVKQHATYDIASRIVVVDLTGVSEEEAGRAPPFMTFTLFPEARVAVTFDTIKNDAECFKVSVGKNIFLRGTGDEDTHDIGELMKLRGGGGHKEVGGCNVMKGEKEEFLAQLLRDLSPSS